MIYIVQGIPASVLFALTGALLTERVYAVPGVGGKMIDALNSHDNAVIVAMTLIFTTISILGEILGDLLLAKYDPRISLSSSSGGGRK
jgi:oligopeptide transport system permease protein